MTTPNTNPSDLDRDDWVASVFVSNHGVDMALEAHIACKLSDGVHKLYARPPLLRASGVPEAEAVAWRWKCKGVEQPWSCTDDAGFIGWILENKHKYIVDELYAAPPPVAAPSGEALRYAAQFLIDRLEDFELDETNAKEMCRQYLGFVEPAIDRLKMELASSIASEPKDAGIPWDQRPAHPMAAWKGGLHLGLYRIHWKDGNGTSLAAIGIKPDGRRWIAATNWVSPCEDPMHELWTYIERAELIIPAEPKDAAITAKQAYRAGFKAAQVWAKVDEIEAAGNAEPKDAGLIEAIKRYGKCEFHAGTLIRSENALELVEAQTVASDVFTQLERSLARPNDAGSGEWHELSLAEQVREIQKSLVLAEDDEPKWGDTIRRMHERGYRIVRGAPSGAKP